jgi:hypothetical protein
VESITSNRFLGSLKVLKYRLWGLSVHVPERMDELLGHLNNMDYTACIEEEYGFCGMEYYQVIP